MKNSKIQDTLKNGLTGAATAGKKVTKTAEKSAASSGNNEDNCTECIENVY